VAGLQKQLPHGLVLDGVLVIGVDGGLDFAALQSLGGLRPSRGILINRRRFRLGAEAVGL
jgi:hypothetical protein